MGLKCVNLFFLNQNLIPPLCENRSMALIKSNLDVSYESAFSNEEKSNISTDSGLIEACNPIMHSI